MQKGLLSRATRVGRNCTDIEDFHKHVESLKEAYVCRGYPISDLNTTINTVRDMDRKYLLTVKSRQ